MTDRRLVTLLPAVAAQWHPTRNGGGPGEITVGASPKVWWRCGAGHEWQEVVAQRTSTAAQWKRGDPAACRGCVPADQLSDHAQVDHAFACGHVARTTVGTIRRGAEKCSSCRHDEWQAEQANPAVRAAKRQAYRERVATLGPRPSLTPEQRQAQRRVLGIMRRSGIVTAEALTLWREARPVYPPGADAAEVSAMLATLEVAHVVTAIGPCAGPFGPRVSEWERVHVPRAQWPGMVVLFPSLAGPLDEAKHQPLGRAAEALLLRLDRATGTPSLWLDGGEIIGGWSSTRGPEHPPPAS